MDERVKRRFKVPQSFTRDVIVPSVAFSIFCLVLWMLVQGLSK